MERSEEGWVIIDFYRDAKGVTHLTLQGEGFTLCLQSVKDKLTKIENEQEILETRVSCSECKRMIDILDFEDGGPFGPVR